MSDLIDKQAALDAIMGQPPEPHYPSWYAAQIEKLPAVQPETNCSEIPNGSDDTISRQAAIDAMKAMYRAAEKWLREAADDVTKARAESCMASLVEIKLRTEKLPAVQTDHNADIGKKVSISCDHENDVISRKMAIEALARMMPRSCTPDGSHPADEEIFLAQEIFADCIEALEILPSAQPEKRWIPCSERLPKVGERVLAQQINGAMQAMKCIDGGHLKWFYSRTVAWMPLPEPYRGGDA